MCSICLIVYVCICVLCVMSSACIYLVYNCVYCILLLRYTHTYTLIFNISYFFYYILYYAIPYIQEGDLSFAPTYKYLPGTLNYDRRPEKKIRPPAWCDRILYKHNNNLNVNILVYDSVYIPISDHMPVFATFNCQGKVIDTYKEGEVYKKVGIMTCVLCIYYCYCILYSIILYTYVYLTLYCIYT